MTEDEIAHRREIERSYLAIQASNLPAMRAERRLGQIIGGVVCVCAIGAMVLMSTYGGHSIEGLAAVFLALGSVVGVFVYGAKAAGTQQKIDPAPADPTIPQQPAVDAVLRPDDSARSNSSH